MPNTQKIKNYLNEKVEFINETFDDLYQNAINPNNKDISKSEIINVDYINYLQLNRNGTIEIKFKNNDFTYSSRRYLKIMKEALKLWNV